MEKHYSLTAIKKITDTWLTYEDQNGCEQTISLIKCRDNWYGSHCCKETFIEKILQTRKRSKYVGDRFWGYNEAYFIFYSDKKIKFCFKLNEQIKYDDLCETRQHFGSIKERLSKAGWLTFDVG